MACRAAGRRSGSGASHGPRAGAGRRLTRLVAGGGLARFITRGVVSSIVARVDDAPTGDGSGRGETAGPRTSRAGEAWWKVGRAFSPTSRECAVRVRDFVRTSGTSSHHFDRGT